MLFRKKPMDGREYEDYVAEVLKRQGFRDIQHTAVTGDYGVDLLARHGRHRYAVQCKYYSGAVGGSAVQEAAAGMAYYDCERALVVTNSYLTPNAHKLAEANGVDILEYVDPEERTFLERRKPWQLVVLAIQCVLFGLTLYQMQLQGLLSVRSCGLAALLIFPALWVCIYICRLIVKLILKTDGHGSKEP